MVQAALVALDVLAALLLVQVTALAHVLAVQVALDVGLVVQADARADVHILAVLNVPDVADVQLVAVKVVLLHALGVVVLALGARTDAVEAAKGNVPQRVAGANLVREHVLQVVRVDVLVALDVLAVVCIHVPVDALLVAINVVQHVGAVAMVARDVRDVLIRVMANAVDVLAAVKADVIVTVLLPVPDATDALILVRDVAANAPCLVLLFVVGVAVDAKDVQVHVRAVVVHHVKLPVLDVLDALTAVQLLALDAVDVQEIALADARVAQRIVVLDALVVVQQDAAIAVRQAALLLAILIVQERAMAHALTRMCHLLNRLTV